MSLGVDYKVLSSLVMVNGAWVTLVVLRAAPLIDVKLRRSGRAWRWGVVAEEAEVEVVGGCDGAGHASGWLGLPLCMWFLGMMIRLREWHDVMLAGYSIGRALAWHWAW